MAGDDVSLKFKLLGDSSDAEQAFERVDNASEETGGKLAAFAVGAAAAGAAAGGMLAAGFAAALDIEEANSKLTAQLGLTATESESAGRVAASVYAGAWGDSISTVNETIRSVSANMGSLSQVGEAEMTKMVTSAQALADTFDIDVNEATQAAGAMMKNGMAKDATEAFDIITLGEQLGTDKAGDFLATLTEYSPQFSKLGIDGGVALNILGSGLKAGARDTDTIADAFKEFSLRAIDGSKSTSDAYKALGMDAQKTAADIAGGGDKARSATFTVLQSLNQIKDPIKQNQLGVALFGTQWEDTLRQILPSVAMAEESEEGLTGATDRMAAAAGDNAKAKVEGLARSFQMWEADMVKTDGTMGLVVAGVGQFGGTAIGLGSQIGMIVAGLGALNLASIGTRVSMMASSVATGVSTAAQWLWNAALSANPLGLIIIAIAALVAGLIWFFTQTELGRQIFSVAMDGMRIAFGWVWDKLQAGFNWVKSNWQLILGILTGPFGLAVTQITKHWDDIKAGFTAAKNWVVNAAKTFFEPLRIAGRAAFNGIATLWNGTVGRIAFTVPSWVPGIGGNSVSAPKIPLMAAGGIATGPTLAMIGEGRGPEAVVPLDRAAEFGFGGGSGGPTIEVHLHGVLAGDQDSFARAVTTAIQQAVTRGQLPRTAFA